MLVQKVTKWWGL